MIHECDEQVSTDEVELHSWVLEWSGLTQNDEYGVAS